MSRNIYKHTRAAVVAVTIVGVVALVATPASAASRSHFVTKFTHVDLFTSPGFPNDVGSFLRTVGPLHVKRTWPDGKVTKTVGLGISKIMVVARPAPLEYTMRGHGRRYFPRGMQRVRFHATSVVDLETLTVSIDGAGRIVGGRGPYRDSRGRFKLHGSRPAAGEGAITETIRGWVITPHFAEPTG
jgi:hypothetical protein